MSGRDYWVEKRDFEPSCVEGKWVKGKWARERFFWVESGLKQDSEKWVWEGNICPFYTIHVCRFPNLNHIFLLLIHK